MDISKRISEIRESKGITQTEVARRLDMEQSNYSRLEKRGNKLTYELIEKIAETIGVTLGELLGNEDAKFTKEVEKLQQGIKDLEKENFDLRAENKMLQKHNEILFKNLDTQQNIIASLMGNQEGIEKFKDIVTGGNPDNEERIKQAATILFPDIAKQFESPQVKDKPNIK